MALFTLRQTIIFASRFLSDVFFAAILITSFSRFHFTSVLSASWSRLNICRIYFSNAIFASWSFSVSKLTAEMSLPLSLFFIWCRHLDGLDVMDAKCVSLWDVITIWLNVVLYDGDHVFFYIMHESTSRWYFQISVASNFYDLASVFVNYTMRTVTLSSFKVNQTFSDLEVTEFWLHIVRRK